MFAGQGCSTVEVVGAGGQQRNPSHTAGQHPSSSIPADQSTTRREEILPALSRKSKQSDSFLNCHPPTTALLIALLRRPRCVLTSGLETGLGQTETGSRDMGGGGLSQSSGAVIIPLQQHYNHVTRITSFLMYPEELFSESSVTRPTD